jgi:hypothetical protein
MDTYQILFGIALSVVSVLAGWLFKVLWAKLEDMKKENDKLREQLQAAKDYEKAENDKLRDLFDNKLAEVHTRINNESKEAGARLTEQAKEHSNLKVTVTGFQGAFMTREEHQRFCNALQARRSGGGS